MEYKKKPKIYLHKVFVKHQQKTHLPNEKKIALNFEGKQKNYTKFIAILHSKRGHFI